MRQRIKKNVNDKWKKVYGRPFPAAKAVAEAAVAKSFAQSWDNTEEFIEDKFPVDIRESMRLDCEVKQNGFRELFLLDMLAKMIPLMTSMSLRFEVKEISAAKPYDIYWKVLNRGNTARISRVFCESRRRGHSTPATDPLKFCRFQSSSLCPATIGT